jgi:hypothetical protein
MMRRLWPDRNPLRRAAGRAGAAVMAGLPAMFLAGVPLAAVAAAGRAAANGVHAERAQARWRQVPAVLLQDARSPRTRCPGRPWSPWCRRAGQRLAGRRARARSTRPAAPGPERPSWCGPAVREDWKEPRCGAPT